MTISFIDPPSVRHLGELASLKSAILSHFHQDSGLYYRSDEQRWQAIVSHYTAAERNLIAGQMREVSDRTGEVAGNFKGALDKSVKDQPMATLALAAAVGFVLGALWKS